MHRSAPGRVTSPFMWAASSWMTEQETPFLRPFSRCVSRSSRPQWKNCNGQLQADQLILSILLASLCLITPSNELVTCEDRYSFGEVDQATSTELESLNFLNLVIQDDPGLTMKILSLCFFTERRSIDQRTSQHSSSHRSTRLPISRLVHPCSPHSS